ncbi:uncharacterized protein LOC126161239 [Schistocerca cancellata]|uniref:uncharacterized protein LOC126161239 n=1 Tax=Schistocerca cancellata TaxID=274614 RepID=UPI002118E998|nr:uncharacterized protein LOC126161239 [Schistocerca cancellata]
MSQVITLEGYSKLIAENEKPPNNKGLGQSQKQKTRKVMPTAKTTANTQKDAINSCSMDVDISSDSTVSAEEPLAEEEWSDDTAVFDFLRVDTKGEPVVNHPLTKHSTERDYFLSLFTNEMLEYVVQQTNLYAEQQKQKRQSGQTICETIHINDNRLNPPRGHPNHNKLHKVRPLITFLSNTICKPYTASKVLAVDESMIPFKGQSSLKQYMPLKPVKQEYKVRCLADSKTNYVIQFDIYTGKSNDGCTENSLGERVVISLTQDLKYSNSLVAFDNFFTTVNLMQMLLNNGIYFIVTVRANRKGLPSMMKDKCRVTSPVSEQAPVNEQHRYKFKK